MFTKLKGWFTSTGKRAGDAQTAQTDTIRIVTVGPPSSGKTSFWQFLLQGNNDRSRLPLHLVMQLEEHTHKLLTQPGFPEATDPDLVVYQGNIRHGNEARSLEIVDMKGGLVGETESEQRERLNDVVKEAHLVLFFLPPEVLEPGKETQYHEVIMRFKELLDTALDYPPKSVNSAMPFIGICFTKADEYGFMPLPDPRVMHNTQSTNLFHQFCRKNDASDRALDHFMQSLVLTQETGATSADVYHHILRHSDSLWCRAIERGHRFINAYWIATGASAYDNRYDNAYSKGGYHLIRDFAEHLRLFFPCKASAGYHAAIGYRYRISFLAASFIALIGVAIYTSPLISQISEVKSFKLKNLTNFPPAKYNTDGLTLKPNSLVYLALSLQEINEKLAAYADNDIGTLDRWAAIEAWVPSYPSEITEDFVEVLNNRLKVYQKFSQLTSGKLTSVNHQLFADFAAMYIQNRSNGRFQRYLVGDREQTSIDDTPITEEVKIPEKKSELRKVAIGYFNASQRNGDALRNYHDIVDKFELHPVPMTCLSPNFPPNPNDEKELLAAKIREVDDIELKKDEVFLIQLQHVDATKGSPSLALVWRNAPNTEILDVLLERNITSRNIKTLSVVEPGFFIALDQWRIKSVGYIKDYDYTSDNDVRQDLIPLLDTKGEAPSLEKMLRVSLVDNGRCLLKENHAQVVRLLKPIAQKLL